MLFEVRVAFGKASAAEKSVVCRKRRGMRALQNIVFAIYKPAFGAGVASPQYEHGVARVLRYQLYHAVGEPLPAATRVRICPVLAHGERGVQKKYALFCPLGEDTQI